MIAKTLKTLLKTSPSRLVGSTALTNASSENPSLTVPTGTKAGDLLILIARCRNDRTLTFWAEWEVKIQTSQGTLSTDTRTYVATKISTGESSVSFTHSKAAAVGAVLIAVRGRFVGLTTSTNNNQTIAKKSYNSDLIVTHVTDGVMSKNFKTTSYVNDFSLLNYSAFLSSSEYFYVIQPHYSAERRQSKTVQISPPTSFEPFLHITIEIE